MRQTLLGTEMKVERFAETIGFQSACPGPRRQLVKSRCRVGCLVKPFIRLVALRQTQGFGD